ncbi:MAG TPA: TonB-dependent receptor [Bryobacteraceae bacterium]
MKYNLIGIAALLLAAATLEAQTATGTIQGNVYDASKATIAGAQVTLTEKQTNQTRSQVSNADGFFEFRALPLGLYDIQVQQAGFSEKTVSGIELQVAATLSINIALRTGTHAESVTVEATAPLLQVADPSLSQVIDEQKIAELPLNGRNVLQLTSLAAGVVVSAKGSASERQANYGPGFSVGGQRDNTNVVLVDGIEISGMELNNYPLAVPSLDSVQEFRVQTSNYSAEFGGNSGAIINVASKHGTNGFHGVLFEFLKNNDLDARNFFSTGVAPLKRNQFGATVGGPVIIPKLYNGKNKTFWLASYEGIRQYNSVNSTALIPTPQERMGNFNGTGTTVVDPFTKVPFPNDTIPVSQISPVGQQLGNLFPATNSASSAANYYGAPAQSFLNDLISARLDHQLTSSDSLFGRFTINQPSTVSPGVNAALSGYDQIQHDWNLQLTAGNTIILTPHIVNETNIGFVRFERGRGSEAANKTDYVKQFGIQGYDPPAYAWAAPQVLLTGLNGVGYGSGNAVFSWLSQSIQIVDNLAIEHGNHTIKTGMTVNKKVLDSTQFGSPNGQFTFSGMFSSQDPVHKVTAADSVADMLLGFPSAFTVQTQPYLQRFHYVDLGFYLQDDWKVTPNLTLNLGLRWEYFGKPTDRNNAIASFNLNTGQQELAGQSGLPRSLVNPDYKDFAPRVGFGWRVFGSNKLSLRGAYGLFYTPEVINSFRNLGFQNPFGTTYTLSVRPANPSVPIPLITAQNPLLNASPAVSFNTVLGINPNFHDGYVGEWNLTAQYALSENTLLEVAYHGSKSTHLSSELNYNQTNPFPAQPPQFALNYPYSAFGVVNMFDSNGDATYNALQVRLEKRYSKGFTILGSYTWLKDLTDVDATSVGVAAAPGDATAPQTITNLALNKGNAVGDRPQQLTVTGLYDLPFLKGRSGWASRILGGWQVGMDSTFSSGSWLTPSSYGVSYTGTRANLVADPNLSRSARSINQWFNVSDVVNPAAGQLGNSAKGTIMGSGNNLWNLIFLKNFRVTETQRLEFRSELFNAFNHPQFDDPNVYPGTNPQAGKITSASDYGYAQTERIIQFGLKYYF